MERFEHTDQVTATEYSALERLIYEKAPLDSAIRIEPSEYSTCYYLPEHNMRVDITVPTMHDFIADIDGESEDNEYFDITDELSVKVSVRCDIIDGSILPVEVREYILLLNDQACEFSNKIELYDIDTGKQIRNHRINFDSASSSEIREYLKVLEENIRSTTHVMNKEHYRDVMEILASLKKEYLVKKD